MKITQGGEDKSSVHWRKISSEINGRTGKIAERADTQRQQPYHLE